MDYHLSSSILSALFVFISLVLAFFLLLEKKKSNRFLAGFLLFTALDISVFFYDQIISLPPTLELFRIRLSAFKNPLLYLYFLSILFSDFKLKARHLVHTLPFLIPVALLTPRFFLADLETKQYFLENYHKMVEIQLIRIFENIVTVIYLLSMVKLIVRYRKLFLQNTSSQKHLETYKWLTQFLSVIIALWMVTFFKNLLKWDNDLALLNNFRTLVLIFGLSFITWLILKALRFPDLFKGVDPEMKTVTEILKQKPERSLFKIDPIEKEIAELKNYMVQNKPYLNPSLTIKELAHELDTNSRDLSLLINKEIGQHFFDFVNCFRIEKAKQLLLSENIDHTVQQIMYDVGFNSKSTFNSAFKKHTGMTPTQYRKTLPVRHL